MADRKSGTVKPPTLDLKAREAKGNEDKTEKPEATKSGSASETPKPTAPADAQASGAAKPADQAKPADNRPADTSGATKPEVNSASTSEKPNTSAAEAAASSPATAAANKEATARPSADKQAAKSVESASGPATKDAQASKPGADKSGTASTASARPGAPSTAKPAEPRSPEGPQRRSGTGAMAAATIVGALLGLGGAYGLAAAGYWPQQPAPQATTDTSALSSSLDQLSARVDDLQANLSSTANDLSARIDKLQSAPSDTASIPEGVSQDIADLQSRVKTLESQPATTPAPNTDLAQQISDLQSQIESQQTALNDLQQAAPPADTGTELNTLSQRLDQLAAEIEQRSSTQSDLSGTVQTLQGDLDQLRQNLSTLDTKLTQTAENQSQSAARIPVALSAYDTALAAGRPFAQEITALTSDLPNLSAPADLQQAAEKGVPRPDQVQKKLQQRLPAILEAKPVDPNSNWTGQAMDRVKAMLAMRPSGEAEGNTPDAVISRLEGAVNRSDFVAANQLMQQLPQPMQQAAGDLTSDISLLAAAQQFGQNAREAALSTTGAAQ